MAFFQMFRVVPLILVFAACGVSEPSKRSDSNPQKFEDVPEPVEGAPSAVHAHCLAAWNTYVGSHAVGLQEERKIEISTQSGSNYLKTVVLQKITILESNAEHVKMALVVDDLEPLLIPKSVNTIKTVSKSEFLKGCHPENPLTASPLLDGPMENLKIIESKQSDIQVGAGTFNCSYRKIQSEWVSFANTTITETWIAQSEGRLFEVKSNSVSRSRNHGTDQTRMRTSELMKRSL